MEQYGLEAASRGAKKVILADNSKEAIEIIKKNSLKTHLEKEVSIYKLDYQDTIENKVNEKQDYIFLDPPYQSDLLYKSIKAILDKKILQDDGIIIAETDKREEFIEQIKNLNIDIIDIRKYGRNEFVFLRKVV